MRQQKDIALGGVIYAHQNAHQSRVAIGICIPCTA